MIRTIVAAPLLLAATQASALYCGTDTNQNHIDTNRAYLQYGILVYANGSNEYLGTPTYTQMIQETSEGYFQTTDTCVDEPTSTETPDKIADENPENRLDFLAEFKGRNYHLALAGSDLVQDIGTDEQADRLDLPRTVYVDIPENAVVEAAWVSYYGSAFLETDGGEDNTDDRVNGAEVEIKTEDDITNNEINITIGDNDLGALTPSSSAAGPDSRSKISWWKFQSPYGTLAYSRIALYNNRIDLTSEFVDHTGSIPVTITRLEKADFAGKADGSQAYDKPTGTNDNGEWANDCLGNASFSVMVVYYLPEGESKTVTIYDGMSWAWSNDFATSKATNPVPSRLSLDIDIQHEAIDATADLNLFLGAVDGDTYQHNRIPQCESSLFKHITGKDYTWVRSGSAQEHFYENIYEGQGAPEVGTAFPDYPEITTVANGLNFNIVKVAIEDKEDEATNTLVHLEGDNLLSTEEPQEAILIAFAVVEAKTKEQTTTINTPPTVTLLGDAEITLEYGATFTDPGATADDVEDGAITPVANCDVNTSTAGTYTCTYTATDTGDLSDTATRTVIVEDEIINPGNTAPEVTLIGDTEITLEYGVTFTDPGATANDAEDGAITPVANCDVNTSIAGTYTCTYTATDSGDLTDTATRTVIVEEEVIQPPCVDFTASYADHETAGRVEVKYYSNYYVIGSGEYLGSTIIGGTATLVETAPGEFAIGSCN